MQADRDERWRPSHEIIPDGVVSRPHHSALVMFGDDVEVPLNVLGRYWAHTGQLTTIQVRRLCSSLYDLSLLAEYDLDTPPRLRLHNVIRAYLRKRTINRQADLDRSLVDAHRSLVPATEEGQSAWWEAPAEERYLWDWLPSHLKGGGLSDELQATVKHPGWLVGKLDHVGPAGLETDLSLTIDPASATLQTNDLDRLGSAIVGLFEYLRFTGAPQSTRLTELLNSLTFTDVLQQAQIVFQQAQLAIARSDHDTARTQYERALQLYQQVGSVLGEADSIEVSGILRTLNSITAPPALTMSVRCSCTSKSMVCSAKRTPLPVSGTLRTLRPITTPHTLTMSRRCSCTSRSAVCAAKRTASRVWGILRTLSPITVPPALTMSVRCSCTSKSMVCSAKQTPFAVSEILP
jgi:hypothetical protein